MTLTAFSTAGADQADTARQPSAADLARQRFVAQAKVEATVWVRERDGYIARFQTTRTYPGATRNTRETIDYTYADFGKVVPAGAPAISEGL